MSRKLVVLVGPDTGRTFPLQAGKKLQVGRSQRGAAAGMFTPQT